MGQQNEPTAATLVDLIVELTGQGIACNFRADPSGRGVIIRLSIHRRDIFYRLDADLLRAHHALDLFVAAKLRKTAAVLLRSFSDLVPIVTPEA